MEIISNKLKVCEEEKILLEEQVKTIKLKHGIAKDNYEDLLIEQFEVMRSSFLKKLEEVTLELNNNKTNHRKSIFYLEEELKQEKQIKDLFVRQISNLQKHFNVEK